MAKSEVLWFEIQPFSGAFMFRKVLRSSFAILFVLAILLGFSISSNVLAQDASASPTPSQEELQLQEQKRLIELQRDIELAKKAIRDAQPQPSAKPTPPEPTATPLAGETTLDEGVRMETDIVSYKAMAEAAKVIVGDIGTHIKNEQLKNVAIYDAQVVKDWRFYQAIFPAFSGQAEDILTDYKDMICPNPGVDPHFHVLYCKKSNNTPFLLRERLRIADLNPDAILSAFSVGGNLIKSFIDLTSLFRTETKIMGKSVTVDEAALVAEVFRALKATNSNINLYYPKVFPPRVDPNGQSETVKLVGLMFIFKSEAERLIKVEAAEQEKLAGSIKQEVQEKAQRDTELGRVTLLKSERDNLYAALSAETVRTFRQKIWDEIAKVQSELSKLKSQSELEVIIKNLKGKIDPVLAKIDANDAAIKPLVDLNLRFQQFADEFVKVDESGTNALALFIRAEDIKAAMPDGCSYWLEIRTVAAGGNNRVRKNLIWYFAGARVDHSGGVIIEYTLYNGRGAVVVSDKLSHYEGYVEPKNIKSGSFRDPDLP